MPHKDWQDEKYSGASLDLGPGLGLFVSYEGMERLGKDEPKWNVFVFGRKLVNRSADKEAAQDRAERVARMWMTKAQAKIGGMLVNTSDPDYRT